MKFINVQPKHGDTRIKSSFFLLFPLRIGNELRWLESAIWQEEYKERFLSGEGYWRKTKWIN